MLVCPVTKGKVYYNKDSNELISLSARLAFKIEDDIPVMLESEARQIDHEEYEKFKNLFLISKSISKITSVIPLFLSKNVQLFER